MRTKRGEETLEIKPQVALGCGFAATMFGPVHEPGNQLDGRRVNNMDGSAKAVCYATPPPSVPESRRERLKVREHCPKEVLSKFRFTLLARMGKPIATRWRCPANRRQRSTVKAQSITNIIQSNRVGKLRVKHCDHMTPSRKRPAHLVHSGLP